MGFGDGGSADEGASTEDVERLDVERLDVERVDVERVHAHLVWLARGRGRLMLRLGQCFVALGERFKELGFARLEGYARERGSQSGAWAREVRRVADRLAHLPSLRGALEDGWISWSMAELCARYATADDERAILLRASSLSVRAMRVWLRERAAAAGDTSGAAAGAHDDEANDARDDDGDELQLRNLVHSVSRSDAWLLEVVERLIRYMDGGAAHHAGPDGWLNGLIAEGQTTFLELSAEARATDLLPEDVAYAQARWRARVAQGIARRAREEAAAEPRLPLLRELEPGETGIDEDEPMPATPRGLDKCIRSLCAALSSRDLYFGGVLNRFFDADGWRRLGYASDTQYARERLGMSRACMRSKMRLTKSSDRLALIARAVQVSELGTAHATLLLQVATPTTEVAWLARAKERTYKHLREEVDLVETLGRLEGTDPLPPTLEEVAAFQALERDVLSGEIFRRAASETSETSEVQTSDTPPDTLRAPRSSVTVRHRVTEDVALHFRQLEDVYRSLGEPHGSFVGFLCTTFIATWLSSLGKSDKWEQIYRRDLYRCSSPVCDCRNCTLHHVLRRAFGGTDDFWNLTPPCNFCHLDGEHGGRLKVRGRAPDALTWWIGRDPILKVRGRALEWAA